MDRLRRFGLGSVVTIFSISLLALQIARAQDQPARLKVFVDCSNMGCDYRFIRSEINVVDFMMDRLAADVHILITRERTGDGGRSFQLIFFGQRAYPSYRDTLRFSAPATATEFEIRDQLVRRIKLGLGPLVAKTPYASQVDVNMKMEGALQASPSSTDKWNYWVYRVQTDGNANVDKNYKTKRLNGRLSANRVTDRLKVGVAVSGGKDKSVYDYETDSTSEHVVVSNDQYNLRHYLIRSLDTNWSSGYEMGYSNNSFSNNRGRIYFRPAVEYDFFPYSEVNNKLVTLSYGMDVRRNVYYDETIFGKTEEVLWGQSLRASASFNQRWGSLESGVAFHHYFNDLSLINLGMQTELDVRVTGGLSVFSFMHGGLVHDQVYLPAEDATAEEVLTRRRALASSYVFRVYFGVTYRFGSKLNNFVNPRFEGAGNDIGSF